MGVTMRDLTGHNKEQLYYVLEPLYQNYIIFTLDLVKLSMSLRAKKQGLEQQKRKFGAVDERFMKRAEELLFGELAAALDISKDRVPEYIADRVSEKRSDNENGFNA